MSKRDSRILEIVSACKRVEVASLAEELGVSAVTMRKDLDALQEEGLLRREHGFAIMSLDTQDPLRMQCQRRR